MRREATPGSRAIGKLLVANRGEIALRVMRTARAMGIRCVAVYSSADRDAAHVAAADEAFWIGEAAPSASYLDIASIIRAAQATGADAIHPGYGFLSENAALATACVDSGLVFVGPPAHAIAAMGDKAEAKRFMGEAGLPCIPGYDGAEQDDDVLAAEAALVGYPLIVKAIAGGGGRGMRVVESPAGFALALASARAEARTAFGNDRVLLERLVCGARHLEIQVLVDRYGHGVHFGERDCSVQRRHQKMIEEAPAPGIDTALRDRLGATAVAAAVRLGYEGVGTFEFLLEPSGNHYFMEMNTRLQVEHPVTEYVAGVDLVACQLRVAMGEPLGFTQADVRIAGHAIEVRLCAEDETRDFIPQSGRIALWRAPVGIRVETAACDGADVPPHYDSMFAKLIAGGRTREEARRRLVAALQDTVCFGLRNNRHALIRCLQHPAFIAGGVDTDFMRQYAAELVGGPEASSPAHVALAAAWAVGNGAGPCALAVPSTVHLRDDAGSLHVVRVRAGGAAHFHVQEGTSATAIGWREAGLSLAHVTLDGVEAPLHALRTADDLYVQWQGVSQRFDDVTYRPAHKGETDLRQIRAQSNGRVARVFVTAGQAVAQGDPVLTIEAMKMEHMHLAGQAGRIMQVSVAEGDLVPTGRVLVELGAIEGAVQ